MPTNQLSLQILSPSSRDSVESSDVVKSFNASTPQGPVRLVSSPNPQCSLKSVSSQNSPESPESPESPDSLDSVNWLKGGFNPQSLSDDHLLKRTDQLVQQERELLSEILHHLNEIDRRKLFCDLGFRSLFDYTVKRLGYSEDQAYRRISAMKLLRELPEIETKIADGSLSLTNITKAHTLFRHEPQIAHDEKLQILSRLENLSSRDGERVILAKSSEPQLTRPDRVRDVTLDTVEIRCLVQKEVMGQLDEIKGLLAHRLPEASLGDIIEALCELGLKHLRPELKPAIVRKNRRCHNGDDLAASCKVEANPDFNNLETAQSPTNDDTAQGRDNDEAIQSPDSDVTVQGVSKTKVSPCSDKPLFNFEVQSFTRGMIVQTRSYDLNSVMKNYHHLKVRRGRQPVSQQPVTQASPSPAASRKRCGKDGQRTFISLHLRRQIWAQARNQCENCGSRYKLEIDHEWPVAKGGGNEPSNLRLLCRNCNERSRVKHFGVSKRAAQPSS